MCRSSRSTPRWGRSTLRELGDLHVLYIYPRTAEPGVGRCRAGTISGRARLHAAVVRLPRHARRAARARRPRGRPLGASARRPDRGRRAPRPAVPAHRRPRPPARGGARPADVRGRAEPTLYERLTIVAERPRSRRSSIPSSGRSRTPRRCSRGSRSAEARDLRRRARRRLDDDGRRAGRAVDARVLRAGRRRARPAASSRSRTSGCARRSCRRSSSIRPGNFREHEEESKHVGWSHEIAPWIVFFQNVDAIVGPDDPIVYPEHLTEELDYELELAVVDPEGGEVVLAGGGGRLHRRLPDLQRHHRARHPAARDALRRLLVLQGDRHVLPARPVDRDAGRDPRPARSADGAARQRREAAGVAQREHVA